MKDKRDRFISLEKDINEISEYLEFEDLNLEKELDSLNNKLSSFEIELLFKDEDVFDAVVEIHAGQGGVEAQDWSKMLYNMISRWTEKKNYTIENYDPVDGKVSGFKSVTLEVKGRYAFGYLKSETGVHRIQRISPWGKGERHTSFASVYVYPLLEEKEANIEIEKSKLLVDTFRAGGPGGQNQNKVESGVRFTYSYEDSLGGIRSIVTSSRESRDQYHNKQRAMMMLKSKIAQIEKEIKNKKIEAIEQTKKDNTFGSQIRTYTFTPYTLVKDHRTGYFESNIDSVMNGDIDGFMKAFLLKLN